jgi:hypothetical protein
MRIYVTIKYKGTYFRAQFVIDSVLKNGTIKIEIVPNLRKWTLRILIFTNPCRIGDRLVWVAVR